MHRTVFSSFFGLAAAVVLTAGLAAPTQAASIGVLPVGGAYVDTISSTGADINESYNFELGADATNVTLLANSQSQTSDDFGIDFMTIALYDAGNNLLVEASGATEAFFDSFADAGIALNAGSYLFTVFADVTTGKNAFLTITLAANPVSAVPLPAGGLLLLTGLGALSAFAWRRRKLEAVKATA